MEYISERIRLLAQSSCWTVGDIDLAWKHMREIPGMSFDKFTRFAFDCQKIGVNSLVPMCQAVQKVVTDQVMMRSGA